MFHQDRDNFGNSKLARVGACVAIGLILTLAVACGDDDNGDVPIPDVAIGAVDFSFDAPPSIPGGLTHITLTNSGTEDHQALLIRLNDGVTIEDLMAAPIETEADLAPYGSLAGGPIAPPGETFDAVLDLRPGSYILLCAIPSPDGVTHDEKGMVATLEVTEPAAEQPSAPEADVSVGLDDFAFDAPDTIAAGETTFDLVNNGSQIHEMGMIKLDEGATVDEALAGLETGEGPFSIIGALYGLEGGAEGWTTIDLTAGTYVLVCFVTDPESGEPHIALGMMDSFTVE